MEVSKTTRQGPDKDAGWRYGMAGLAAAVGIAARFALNPLLGFKLSYITFFPAVVFATWTGGVGPGVLCIALTSLAAALLYLPSATSLWIGDPTDAAGLVIYVLVSTLLVAMIGAQRAAERRASASTDSARAAHGEVTAILESITDSFYAVDRDWRSRT